MIKQLQDMDSFIEANKFGSGYSEERLTQAYMCQSFLIMSANMVLDNDDSLILENYLLTVSKFVLNIALLANEDTNELLIQFMSDLRDIEHLGFDDKMVEFFNIHGMEI